MFIVDTTPVTLIELETQKMFPNNILLKKI